MSQQYDPFLGTGPEVLTVNDAIEKAVASLVDQFMPGGAGRAFSPMLTKGVKGMLGIKNDAMLDSVLMTNMTPMGVYRYQQQTYANRIADAAMDPMRYASKFKFFQGLQKTMTSKAAWERMRAAGETSAESYQEYIDMEATNKANSGLWGYMYSMVDPFGTEASSKYMGVAATNMIRRGLAAGDRMAYSKASYMVGNLFKDNEGNFSFNPKDYGHMSQGEVAALTAAITKDSDLFSGGPGSGKTDDLKAATNKLRERIKKYSDALSPLKDVFGKDVPGMIKAIEEISGQSLSQMSPERARQIAMNAVDSTASGRYSMSDLAGLTGAYTTALGQMNVPVLSRVSGMLYATRSLDATQGGIMPSTMTRQEFVSKTGDWILRASASEGADDFNMAYSLWAQRAEGQKQDSSLEAFKSAYAEALNRNGGNASKAYLQLAGVTSRYALGAGRASDKYMDAVDAGLGADMAVQTSYNNMRRSAARQIETNANIQDFLRMSGDKAVGVFNNMEKLLEGNVEIFDMSPAARKEALRKRADELKLNLGTGDIDNVDKLMYYMQNTQSFQPIVRSMYAQQNMAAAAKAKATAYKRRDTLEKLQGMDFASSTGDLLGKVFGLYDGKGLVDGNISKYLGQTSTLFMGDKEAMQDAVWAGSSALLSRIDSLGTEKQKALKDWVMGKGAGAIFNAKYENLSADLKRQYTKEQWADEVSAMRNAFNDAAIDANTAQGLGNVKYMEYLRKGGEAKSAEEQRKYWALASAYKTTSTSALDRFINTNGTKGLTGTQLDARIKANQEQLAKVVQERGQSAVVAFLENAELESTLNEKQKQQLKKAKADLGITDAEQRYKSVFDKDLQEKLKGDEYKELRDKINQAGVGANRTGGGIQDVLGTLNTVLQQFMSFLNKAESEGKYILVKGNQATQGSVKPGQRQR